MRLSASHRRLVSSRHCVWKASVVAGFDVIVVYLCAFFVLVFVVLLLSVGASSAFIAQCKVVFATRWLVFIAVLVVFVIDLSSSIVFSFCAWFR